LLFFLLERFEKVAPEMLYLVYIWRVMQGGNDNVEEAERDRTGYGYKRGKK